MGEEFLITREHYTGAVSRVCIRRIVSNLGPTRGISPLPRYAAELTAGPAYGEVVLEHRTEKNLMGKERVLLVDDEEAVVEMLSGILERLGYGVRGETNSNQALRLFAEDPHRFDVVITDEVMPLMSGSSLAKKIP